MIAWTVWKSVCNSDILLKLSHTAAVSKRPEQDKAGWQGRKRQP